LNDADHDLLIGLRAEGVGLHSSIETHNIASVERDTRIEIAVKEINGTVGRHEQSLILHAQVPHSGVDHAASAVLIGRIDEMWTAWSIGKWVGTAAVLAMLGQSVALMVLIVKG